MLKLRDYHDYELATDAIELTSISKREIVLPYSGVLPHRFDYCEDPRITITPRPTGAALKLTSNLPSLKYGKRNPKTTTAIITATDQEITDLLRRFFFRENGKTRFDCGLSHYWLGFWQAIFTEWERTRSYHGTLQIIGSMEPAEREKLFEAIQRIQNEQQAGD